MVLLAGRNGPPRFFFLKRISFVARYQHLPLYQATYAYTKEIYRLKCRLPKLIRHDLGQDLFRSSVKALKLIVFANGLEKKKEALLILSLEMEVHWVWLRLLVDTKAVSVGEFKALSERLSEITQQIS
ncbi:MAG: hypothetical protein EBZ49_11335, partial [Proteobacteria bacterium]|nr:hypothetical protein [Pseudomonadota bacterium]